jgi:hypothetical protein
MHCLTFRTDPATLIETLTSEPILRQYIAAYEAEIPSLADRTLGAHVRRLNGLAVEAMTIGFTTLAKRDAAHADALLSDLFAVATWHGWELPLTVLGEMDVAVDGLPRGLLGVDPGREGAGVWVIDHATVALARNREAGEADWHEHHPRGAGGCNH